MQDLQVRYKFNIEHSISILIALLVIGTIIFIMVTEVTWDGSKPNGWGYVTAIFATILFSIMGGSISYNISYNLIKKIKNKN